MLKLIRFTYKKQTIKILEKNGIVPDVIDEAPKEKLTVIYDNKNLELGEELTPTEVKNQPKVSWVADPNKFYFLSMVDPDAPSRKQPEFAQVNHWAVGNIKGNDLNTGKIIAEYRGSGPPKGSGLHRYVFLVFEQNGKLVFNEKLISAKEVYGRVKFSLRKFAEKYNLGKPLFVNYFEAQWDEYVDKRQKE